jgi:large subunit ribosomal protein L13
MAKIIIDASGAAVGRLASYAAKQALEGNEIIVLNSEKAVVTGNRDSILEKYSNMKAKGGNARRGPFYSRVSYMMLKRTIKKMLPDFRWGIGKQALSRVKCYNGVPKEFEKEKTIKMLSKSSKSMELGDVSKRL